MDKDRYELESPYSQNNWLIFRDAVYGQIAYTTCGDSQDGKCLEDVSFDECLAHTGETSMGGYYIEGESGTICVPLKRDEIRNYQPYHALRPSRIYKELDNYKTKAFVNERLYKFPPVDITGLVTYRDNFLLENLISHKTLSFEDENDLQKFKFYKYSSSKLELLPVDIPIPYISYRIPVRNKSKVIITMPNSSMLLRYNDVDEKLEWVIRVAVLNNPENAFTIHNASHPESEYISFEDNVYFSRGDRVLSYDDEKDVLECVTSGANKVFKLIPERMVYYRETSTKCTGIPLKDTVIQGGKAFYKDEPTYRRNTCWQGRKPVSYVPYYVMGVFIVLIVIFIIKV